MGLNRGDVLVVTLEAAMGADLTADPSTWTWTDLSSRTKGVATIVRGRADEAQQTQPSSLTIRLGNTDGALTPRHPMSSWYLLWAVGTPLRLKVTIPGDATYTRFQGRVTIIKPVWPSGNSDVAFVDVTAKGALYNLQQGSPPPRSDLYRSTAAAKSAAYWSLEEGSTSTSFAEANGRTPMTWSGTPPKRASGGPPGSAPLVTLAADTSLIGNVIPYAETSPGWWGVQAVVRVPDAQGGDVPFLNVYMDGGTYSRWQLWYGYYGGPGGFYWLAYDQFGVASAQLSGTSLTTFPDGKTWGHDIIVGYNIHQNGANIAIDGAFVSPDEPAGTRLFNTSSLAGTNGKVTRIEVPSGTSHANWTVGHFSVWPGQFSLYGLQMNGNDGESVTARLSRLCTEQGIPLTINYGAERVTEGFESASLAVAITGTWARDSSQFHTGAWSYKSAAITHSQTTDAVVTVPVGATTMAVWYKVSSESGFDFFRILRDGVLESEYSGEVAWTQRTISVTGVSQVTFRYIKDGSASAGLDAAWIDDIVFAGLSVTKMGPQRIDTLNNLLRECEAADGGILADGLTGGLQYFTRGGRYNQPVALALDASRGQVKWPPFEPIEDDQRLRTKFIVSRVNGSSATFTDPSAKTRGEYPGQANLVLADDSTLAAQASWRANLFTVPEMRTPSIAIDVRNSPELLSPYLAADIGKRYTAANPPAQYPPGGLDLVLEQYTETIDATTWRVLLGGSPYAPWRVFVVNTDRVDGDGYTLAAGVNATATTLSVASTTGLLWVTNVIDPGAFPFDIEVAGIRLRVTNISGTSSPQTFTVRRSMDGFDKPLPVNSPVRLWRPPVIAL